jgi:hypothetical protein
VTRSGSFQLFSWGSSEGFKTCLNTTSDVTAPMMVPLNPGEQVVQMFPTEGGLLVRYSEWCMRVID